MESIRSSGFALRPEPQAQPGGYVPALDVIRGAAVLLVMAFHFNVPGANAAGRLGVTLFFVLSGYLITRHVVSVVPGGFAAVVDYLGRRALRIGPALAGLLIVILAVTAVAGTFTEVAPGAMASALFVANAPVPLGIDLPWLSHMWSLSLEVQFYVVLPLLMLAAIAHRLIAAIVIAGVAGGLLIYPEASGIGIGCALALGGARFLARRWPPLLVAAGIALVLLSAMLDNQSGYYHVGPAWIASIGSGFIVAAALRSPLLTWNPLRRVGLVSYSLYLWHLPIGTALFPAAYAAGFSWWMAAIGATVTSLFVAALSYMWIERPFMTATFRNHLARSATQAALAVARPALRARRWRTAAVSGEVAQA